MTFRLERLERLVDIGDFDCGHEALGRWLTEHARTATRHGTRTSVLLGDDDSIAGYFALTPHSVARADMPTKINRGSPDPIPGYMLGKLAVARHLQAEGLGTELLIAAQRTVIEAARNAGGKLLVVDAIDERAAAFYVRRDFIPCGSGRLVMKISTAARALEIPWP